MLQRAPGKPSSRRWADLLEHAGVARALFGIAALPPPAAGHLALVSDTSLIALVEAHERKLPREHRVEEARKVAQIRKRAVA